METLSTPPDVGFRLGRYEVIKRLAVGGMAEIFLARVRALSGFQKMVVIKRILPALVHKRDYLEMFLNEARLAAALQHPNVVQSYEVGVVDGNHFIAMEYLHGEDLRAIQLAMHKRKQTVPLEQALQIAIGVCGGLHYAHEKVGYDGRPLHIVHRDVSPQNVFVTYDGAVKLIDFGVAKAATGTVETACGIIKGKISYLSPEQVWTRPLDRRSDVFSLGIILYELTLGRRLFMGASELETLKRIVERPVPRPRHIDSRYDPRLEEILMRALAKDREQRYPSARALQIDLESLARERGIYCSSIALQQFMEGLFGHKLEAWQDVDEGTPVIAVKPLGGEAVVIAVPTEAQGGSEVPVPPATVPPDAFDGSPADARPATSTWMWPFTSSGALRRPVVAMGMGVGVLLLAAIPMVPRSAPRQEATAALSPPMITVEPPVPTLSWKEPTESLSPLKVPASRAALASLWPLGPVAPDTHFGSLRVDTKPPGATLVVDGHLVKDVTPTTIEGLEAGTEHLVVAQRRGFAAAELRLKVAPGKTAERTVRLERERRAAPPPAAATSGGATGSLVLAATPWCEVSVDGVGMGPTPVSLRLAPGRHRVRLGNSEFHIDKAVDVVVRAQQTVRKRFEFGKP